MHYPDRHHPVFFLQDALLAKGADAVFARDAQTEGCWGLIVNGKPMVWLIDNRWPHERQHEDPAAARLLERGAIVCCAQLRDAERVGGKWLPLAATPGYRLPEKIAPSLFDVAFVGYVRDMTRARILADVRSRYTVSLGQGIFGDEALRTYWSARCAVNIPTRYGDQNAYDVPMRVMEVAATGVPLVTNTLQDLSLLGFQNGTHCLEYDSPETLLHCIQVLVSDREVARDMGLQAHALIEKRHTYAHRAEQVLEWL
jgi:hypothetical protein